MKRKKFILLCLIIFILSLATVSASENINQTLSISNMDSPDTDIVSVSNDDTILNSHNENQTLSENEETTGIWYVNASQSGGNGKTPETAFKTLKDAIDSSEEDNTIMIASGLYTGSGNGLCKKFCGF